MPCCLKPRRLRRPRPETAAGSSGPSSRLPPTALAEPATSLAAAGGNSRRRRCSMVGLTARPGQTSAKRKSRWEA
eukprot:5686799-Lingulodinium_polyedra.AAC.1